MRIFTLLIFTFLLSACTKSSHEELKKTAVQARVYSEHFNQIHRSPPILSKFKKGELIETFYFDLSSKRLGYALYNQGSPYKQFFEILKKNKNLSYSEASNYLKSSFKNYFAKDCPNIGEFLSRVESLGVEYKQKRYSLSLDGPTYKYYYAVPKQPTTYTLITGVEEHPVAKLNQEAHEAIKNCPHPKDPPKL